MSFVSFPELKSTEEDLISFKDGWSKAAQCVDAYIELLEEKFAQVKTLKELMSLKVEHIQYFTTAYDILFNMCIQRDPYNWSSNIYESSVRAIQNYVENKCVPAMEQASSDQHFVWEWTKRWQMIKCFADAMNRIFMYLNRFYIPNSENDKVTARENVFREYRDKIYERYQRRARKIVISSLSRIYSEHHPCDCPSPQSLFASGTGSGSAAGGGVVAVAATQRKRPSASSSSSSGTAAGTGARGFPFETLPGGNGSGSGGSSIHMDGRATATTTTTSEITSSPSPSSRKRSSLPQKQKRSSLSPSSAASSSSSAVSSSSSGAGRGGLSDGTTLKRVLRDTLSGGLGARQRVHVANKEDGCDKHEASLPRKDARNGAKSKRIFSPSTTKPLSPSRKTSSSSMAPGDDEDRSDDEDSLSSSPLTKHCSSSSSSEDPFPEEKLEFPLEPPAVPSSSLSSTSSLLSCSSVSSSTSSASSSPSSSNPPVKSRRTSSAENADELMTTTNSSSSSSSCSPAAAAAAGGGAVTAAATTTTTSSTKTVHASRRRVSPSTMELATRYEELLPNERICPQDLCLCAKVAYEEIYKGRLFLRDFEPYECQLLLESQMRLIMQTTNLPAESLCGVIISFAFNLRGDPRQQHESPSSNDSSRSSSSSSQGRGGSSSPPPQIAGASSGAAVAANNNGVPPPSSSSSTSGATATALAALAAAAAEGHAGGGAGAASGSHAGFFPDGSTPHSLPMHRHESSSLASSDLMDTTVTPTYAGGRAMRRVNALREMLVSGDVDPEVMRHRMKYAMGTRSALSRHVAASSRALRRRQHVHSPGRGRGRGRVRGGSSAAPSSSAHADVAETLCSMRSGSSMQNAESMPLLMESSPTRSPSSSFEYDFEHDEYGSLFEEEELNALRDRDPRRHGRTMNSPPPPPHHHHTPLQYAMTPPPDLSRPFTAHSAFAAADDDDDEEDFQGFWPSSVVGYPLLGAQATPPPTPAPPSSADSGSPSSSEEALRSPSGDTTMNANAAASSVSSSHGSLDDGHFGLFYHMVRTNRFKKCYASSRCAAAHRTTSSGPSSSSSSSSLSSGVSPSLGAMSLNADAAVGGSSSSPPSTSSRFFRTPNSQHSMFPDRRTLYFRAASNPLAPTASPMSSSSTPAMTTTVMRRSPAFPAHDNKDDDDNNPLFHRGRHEDDDIMGLAHAAPSPPPRRSDMNASQSNTGVSSSTNVILGTSSLNTAGATGREHGLAMSELTLAAPLSSLSAPPLDETPPSSDPRSQMVDSPSPPPASPPVGTTSRVRRDSMEIKEDGGFSDVYTKNGNNDNSDNDNDDDDVFLSDEIVASCGTEQVRNNLGPMCANANAFFPSPMSYPRSVNGIMGVHRRDILGGAASSVEHHIPRVLNHSGARSVSSLPRASSSSVCSSSRSSAVPTATITPSATTTTTSSLSHTRSSSSHSSTSSSASGGGLSSLPSSRRRTAADVVDDEDGANAADGRRVRSRLLSPTTVAAVADSPDAMVERRMGTGGVDCSDDDDDDDGHHIDSSSSSDDQDMSPPPSAFGDGAAPVVRSAGGTNSSSPRSNPSASTAGQRRCSITRPSSRS